MSSRDSGLPPPTVQNSQLRFFQTTTAVLAILLLIGLAYYYYRQHMVLPVTVVVNNKPIATADGISAATLLVKSVHTQEAGQAYMDKDHPRFTEDVVFQRAPADTPIDSTDEAARKLGAATHTVVDADVILVNKKPIVGLPDPQAAQAAVDELREHYSSMPPVDAQLVEKPSFVQTVTIERRAIPVSLAKTSVDEAAAVLWTPPPPKTYAVMPHETGWEIARKFKIPFGDFLRANAGHDVNKLAPGDTVVVSETFPPVDVIVKKQQDEKQTFGDSGVRQLTVEETYVDGVLTGTPIATNMITLKRATPRGAIN